MPKQIATRLGPLDGKLFANSSVSLTPANHAARINLRVRENNIAKINKLLGFKLPTKPKTSIVKGSKICLWLAPDEWLLFDEAENSDLNKLEAIDAATASAVNISHRNCAIIVSGPKAHVVLNSGCPQNLCLDKFSVGAASRTILGKAEIVLYRTKEQTFRIESWRSFSDYVWTFLEDAAKSA